MKFGRYLEETQIPEWKKAYIDYHTLKKRIKDIRRAQAENEPLLTEEVLGSPIASTSGVQLGGAKYGSIDQLQRQSHSSSPPTRDNVPSLPQSEDEVASKPTVVLPQPVHSDTPEGTRGLQVPSEAEERPKLAVKRAGVNMRAYSEASKQIPRRSQTHTPGSDPKPRPIMSNQSLPLRQDLQRTPSGRLPFLPKRSSWLVRKATQRLPKSIPLADLLPTLSPVQRKFFETLDGELDKIEKFYSEREREATIKLGTLKEQLRELQEHRELYHQAQDAEQRRSYAETFVTILDKLHIPHPRHPISEEETNNDDGRKLRTPLPGPAALKNVIQRQVQHAVSHIASQSSTRRRDPDEYVHAKKKLKKAILEYHRGVEFLNNYRILNITGFKKALKKFEKVTQMPASDAYMKEKVDMSSFSSGQPLERVLRETEELYAKSFEQGDVKKARTRLRTPWQERSKHHLSIFKSGLFLGLAFPALALGIYESFQADTREAIPYWSPLLFVYAVFFVPTLFSLLIGLNIIIWSQARINYQFIFELDVHTQIDSREYFELPSLLLLALCYAFWFSFTRIGMPGISPTAWPLVWLVFTCIVMFDPFPFFFKSSRFWLAKSVGNLFLSGTRRVEFTDFWLGLPFALANLYFVGCAYNARWVNVWEECTTSSRNWGILAALAVLPSFIRLVQSVKRWVDSRLITHLINGGKYGSSIMFYLLYYHWRSTGSKHDASFVIWIIFAVFYSCYTSAWDLWMDWSVLRPRAKYPFLRDDLVYSDHIPLYYIAIVTNILIRFGWVIYLSERPNTALVSFVAGFLEMLRRCQWNFFRLENEHLGNTDQYRVTREVPLPYTFREAEDSEASDRSRNKKTWLQCKRSDRERGGQESPSESTIRSVHLPEVERDGRMAWNNGKSRDEEEG